MDQEDYDLKLRIKEFLSKDAHFRNPNFDPAPYLISILKDKSADHEAMIEKQNELIELQNQAQEIIDDVCGEHCENFIKLLEVPAFYAENLQKLKSNVSVVKKKVKQTKALLLNTQKDLQQIHYNCMFNKLVYKKLKEIEMRLYQYEAAFLALKNNQFMLCSINLPHIEGHSILQSALVSRSENLKLRMLSKALDLVNMFLFFSPKIVYQSTYSIIERISIENKEEELISNWNEHATFFKRYKLFQKAEYKSYLEALFDFEGLERKEGKIALMNDIVKGVINIGRINEITSSIQINGPKQIVNIFLLLKCFYIKQRKPEQDSNRWFMDRSIQDKQGKIFISTVMCVVGVIFRKAILIHKICHEFGVEEFGFTSSKIYEEVIKELQKLIKMLYFPQVGEKEQERIEETGEQQLNQKIGAILSSPDNYICYGHAELIIKNSLKIIEVKVSQLEGKLFGNQSTGKDIRGKHLHKFAIYDKTFYMSLHKDFFKTMEEIFGRESRSFLIESYEAIMGSKNFNEDEDKFMKGYRSAERKAIKQYIHSLSFLKNFQEYFKDNELDENKLHRYILCFLAVFYLKLNHYFCTSLVSGGELMVIDEQRKTDKKLRKKEEEYRRVFYKFLSDREIKQQPKSDKNYQSNSSKIGVNSFQVVDKLKVFQKQNKMLFSFCYKFFDYLEKDKNSERMEDFITLITKLEPLNYEENLSPKILRVWDTLPEGGPAVRECTVGVLYKLMELSCKINAKIFREAGSYQIQY